jgi:hypothetical protein
MLERIYEASRDADHFREQMIGWHTCEDDPEAGTLTIRLRRGKGGIVFITYDVATRKLLTFRFYEPPERPERLLGGG